MTLFSPGCALARRGLPLALAALLGSCFESGPLELAPTSGADDTSTDGAVVADASDAGTTPPTPEVEVAEDSAIDSQAIDTEDVEPTDGVETDLGETNSGEADGGEARPCLDDDDCAGLESDDRCAGPIRCLDYNCRPDPTLAVVCEADSPCVASRCDPATGACVEEELCSCETEHTLRCDIPRSWTVGQEGSRTGLAGYACGPADASPTMRMFSLDVSGRVRLSTSGDVRGLHVHTGELCDGITSCLAGGDSLFYFDAEGGERYTLTVEEGDSNALLSVRADCDITRELACKDGLDDDADGATDCDDRDCSGLAGCATLPPETEAGLCGDQLDNDVDGATDCDDEDCIREADCLESCTLVTRSLYCNYSQGLDNGSGEANAIHYSCNPVPQTARELVFPITADFTGPVRIVFQSQAGLALHLLAETGLGCTPRDCVEMSAGDLEFDIVEGQTYYLAVDGPGELIGSFYIELDCLMD